LTYATTTQVLYKADEAPVDAALADRVTPDHMPVPWIKALNTSAVKAAIWAACMVVLKETLSAGNTRGAEYFIVDTADVIRSVPSGMPLGPTTYGEGDQLAVITAEQVSTQYDIRPALVVTNDIDLAVISLLRQCDIDVSLGTYIVFDTSCNDCELICR